MIQSTQLRGGIHERASFASRFLADHAALAYPEVKAISAVEKVLDRVEGRLDPSGRTLPRGTGCFGGDRFDQGLSPGRFVGGGDAVVCKVQQKQRCLEWPDILCHGPHSITDEFVLVDIRIRRERRALLILGPTSKKSNVLFAVRSCWKLLNKMHWTPLQ